MGVQQALMRVWRKSVLEELSEAPRETSVVGQESMVG